MVQMGQMQGFLHIPPLYKTNFPLIFKSLQLVYSLDLKMDLWASSWLESEHDIHSHCCCCHKSKTEFIFMDNSAGQDIVPEYYQSETIKNRKQRWCNQKSVVRFPFRVIMVLSFLCLAFSVNYMQKTMVWWPGYSSGGHWLSVIVVHVFLVYCIYPSVTRSGYMRYDHHFTAVSLFFDQLKVSSVSSAMSYSVLPYPVPSVTVPKISSNFTSFSNIIILDAAISYFTLNNCATVPPPLHSSRSCRPILEFL